MKINFKKMSATFIFSFVGFASGPANAAVFEYPTIGTDTALYYVLASDPQEHKQGADYGNKMTQARANNYCQTLSKLHAYLKANGDSRAKDYSPFAGVTRAVDYKIIWVESGMYADAAVRATRTEDRIRHVKSGRPALCAKESQDAIDAISKHKGTSYGWGMNSTPPSILDADAHGSLIWKLGSCMESGGSEIPLETYVYGVFGLIDCAR